MSQLYMIEQSNGTTWDHFLGCQARCIVTLEKDFFQHLISLLHLTQTFFDSTSQLKIIMSSVPFANLFCEA